MDHKFKWVHPKRMDTSEDGGMLKEEMMTKDHKRMMDSTQVQSGLPRQVSQKAEIVQPKPSRIFIQQKEKSCQTEQDSELDILRAKLEEANKALAASQKENARVKEMMQEQKRGFDKLSAQAYKKIKELLTDRNIMSVEIKSLQSQVSNTLM
jgi:hypothetical protein